MENFDAKLGRRKFYDIPKFVDDKELPCACKNAQPHEIIQFIPKDIVGSTNTFTGPYGGRKIVYCDHIASSRALNSIEIYIRDHILPNYGNTHTMTTVTSLQSSMFQQEARTMIRNVVRANEHDAVIFTGTGVTAAVHKLINALDSKSPPVVFVGPFEHHSNLLPWREIAAYIVPISETFDGRINMEHLELALQAWSIHDYQLIGCLSAASNVTGVITDTVAVTALLHSYGALAFWDFATGGPYLDIDMHPHCNTSADKDAVFLSMHKFVGGIDAPGVLVAKRSLFKNDKPTGGGGGSVFFVRRNSHRYLQDEEMREEGGTPQVVGIVRAALALELKQSIGAKFIMEKEEHFYLEALKVWQDLPNLHLLGNHSVQEKSHHRLAVFSFMIYHPDSKLYLHHNFVAALLNDIFGIQARGGCACAGPYAQDLLGIDEDTAERFERVLLEDSRLDRVHLRRTSEYSSYEILRPGFVRLNIPYFASPDEAHYVIRAVAMVAKSGWRCLPSYKFNPETGEWRHIKHKVFVGRSWLGHARFTAEGLKADATPNKPIVSYSYEELLKMADDIMQCNIKVHGNVPDHQLMFGDQVQGLRWFLLPSEALSLLRNKPVSVGHSCAISVRRNVKQLTKEEIIELVKPQKFCDLYSEEELTDIFTKMKLKIKNFALNEKLSLGDKETNFKDGASNTDMNSSSLSCSFVVRKQKNDKSEEKSEKFRFVSPSKRLFKLTAEAIEEFNMIENEDRVLVCLSGGKDSLSLLHVLHQYQFYSKSKGISFELGAVTVNPMTSSYDPSPLIPYLNALGVSYFYEEQDILSEAIRTCASSICAFCSRMKRGRIYACARREGWNVLAFGQHLDDLAESFLMSAFHNGLLRTMKANYLVKEGDLRVIRPLVYVRETDTRHFAETAKLPIIPENCPACFEAPKERHRMKQLLAAQEILHPRLFASLKESLHPLMAKNKTGMESGSKLGLGDCPDLFTNCSQSNYKDETCTV